MPLAPIEGTLPCLMGLSVIRGKPCPVVHLARLLGEEGEPQRLVLLRLAGERRVALAVSSVEGVRRASHEALAEMPSLVSPANADLIEAVATRDADLMLLLRAGAILSEDDWKRLESA